MSDPLDRVFGAYPQTLTVDQLAELLGVNPQMTYRWLQRGAVPGYKVAGSWVIYRDEVKEHLRTERADRINRHRDSTASDQPGEAKPSCTGGAGQD